MEFDLIRVINALNEIRTERAAKYFDYVVGNYFSLILASGKTKVVDSLRSRFDSISMIYRQRLGTTDSRPDWSNGDNRRSYVYRFFAMHCYIVYRSLQLSLADFTFLAKSCTGKSSFHVCCIGGGPGSDLVGLTKFLRDKELFPVDRLECSIFDLYQQWESDWVQMARANPGEFPSQLTYFPVDITHKQRPLSKKGLRKIQAADIITVVKVFSSVAAFVRKDAAHGRLLREIFQEMKPGALVLYIDNRNGDKHNEFQTMAHYGGVREVLFKWQGEMGMPSVEKHSTSIRHIAQKTGFRPLQRCNVTIMILRKPYAGWWWCQGMWLRV